MDYPTLFPSQTTSDLVNIRSLSFISHDNLKPTPSNRLFHALPHILPLSRNRMYSRTILSKYHWEKGRWLEWTDLVMVIHDDELWRDGRGIL